MLCESELQPHEQSRSLLALWVLSLGDGLNQCQCLGGCSIPPTLNRAGVCGSLGWKLLGANIVDRFIFHVLEAPCLL